MQKMDFINLDKWRVLNEPLFKSYIECFSLLENKTETVMHLPHVVERAILGKPHEAITHLENGLNISQNLSTQGSTC